MSAFLLGFLAIEAQFICTAALITVCTLAGAYYYLIGIKKPHGREKSLSDLPQENCLNAENLSTDESLFEEKNTALPIYGDKTIRGRYNKSFTAKLIMSTNSIKQYYADLANELLSYDKVRNRISWTNSTFYMGRKTLSKFSIRGKTLYLYLALEPRHFQDSKFFATDESSVKKYENVPLRVKVKSRRGTKFAKELIEILMKKFGAVRAEQTATRVKLSDFPYDTAKNLLARGLIKLKTVDGQSVSDSDRLVWADFERRKQVAVTEAKVLISDEVAVSLIDDGEDVVWAKPKGIVNIDTLSENYQANDTVTLQSLKEKKLVGNSVNFVKVLARGVLNKPLTVKLHEFSVDAVKMIVLTGGKAVRLKTEKLAEVNQDLTDI